MDHNTFQTFCKQYHITLNPQQEQAVQAIDGANLLLAVPGSGKTTVLVARLGYMILSKGISPGSILAMTFSNQAADDMQKRFAETFGLRLASLVLFKTIHKVAYEVVRNYARRSGHPAPEMLSDNTKQVTQILRQAQQEYPSESEVAEACAAITYIKNMSVPVEEISKEKFSTPNMESIYKQYQQILKQNRWMDYDDQILFALQILKARPEMLAEYRQKYHYICIDEAQDTSKSQHELLELFVGDGGNVFMVGDEDQSIYRFRGAFPAALLKFGDTYPNASIMQMETNYRSTPEIVDMAARFISNNKNRYPKNMTAHRKSGAAVERIDVVSRNQQYAKLLEVAKRVPSDTAVVYRDNDSAIPLIDLFERNGVPYRCPKREFRFFTHKVVRDVVAFMRLQQNPRDMAAFRQICYKGEFYLDKRTVQFACDNVQRHKITFLESLQNQAQRFQKISTAVNRFAVYCRDTASLKALDFLRYLKENGYGRYLEKEQMDSGKLDLLMAIADENPAVPEFLTRLEQLEAITKEAGKSDKGIILTTAHSSKGLEYDTVYLMDVYDGLFPCVSPVKATENPDDMDMYQEERRLFYVAMTRAKNHLRVFKIKGKVSCFVNEVLPAEPTVTFYSYSKQELNSLEKEYPKQEQETEKKRAAAVAQEALEKARLEKGFAEIKEQSFQTEEMVVDSFGTRWLQCERCNGIKPKDGFALIGRLNQPGIGICNTCARAM